MNIREASLALVVADNNIGNARNNIAKATKTRNDITIQSAISEYNKAHDAYELAYANLSKAKDAGV